jgi:predicted dehydrogenase
MVGLFGMPGSIVARGYTLPGSIDGMGSITATYDGMLADLSYSKISDSRLPCEIQGEKGTMTFTNIGEPQNIVIRYRNGQDKEFMVETNSKNMVYEVEGFIDIVSGKIEIDEYHAISTGTMELMDEARRQIGIVYPADSVSNIETIRRAYWKS